MEKKRTSLEVRVPPHQAMTSVEPGRGWQHVWGPLELVPERTDASDIEQSSGLIFYTRIGFQLLSPARGLGDDLHEQ